MIYACIAMVMLVGLVYAMTLWLSRKKEDKFSYKVLKPLSFTIILGSLISTSVLFASNWIIPKGYSSFNLFDSFYFTQEILFYVTYVLLFIYVIVQKNSIKIIRSTFYLSLLLLFVAFIAHNLMSDFTII